MGNTCRCTNSRCAFKRRKRNGTLLLQHARSCRMSCCRSREPKRKKVHTVNTSIFLKWRQSCRRQSTWLVTSAEASEQKRPRRERGLHVEIDRRDPLVRAAHQRH